MSPDPEMLVSVEYAAQRTGLSAKTIRKMLKNGTAPPHARLSPRRVVFKLGELNRWIEDRFAASSRTPLPIDPAAFTAPTVYAGGTP